MATSTPNTVPESRLEIEYVSVDSLTLDPANARLHPVKNLEGIRGSLLKYGQQKPIVVSESGVVIAGNGYLMVAREFGWKEVAVVRSKLKGADAIGYGIADNATALSSEWDNERLAALVEGLREEEFDMSALGFDVAGLDSLLGNMADEASDLLKPKTTPEEARVSLAERFGIPPFSVMDARQGIWQKRKNAWIALGLRSFEGRDQSLLYANSAKPPAFYALRNEMRAAAGGVDPSWDEINAEATKRGMLGAAVDGTSIFDPVLCELAYRWFCPPTGVVLDPFAGGSVRGLVAAKLGRKYWGVDLRPEQVKANEDAWHRFAGEHDDGTFPRPRWLTGDSCEMMQMQDLPTECDFLFSCPPYADLERYSDDARDLSTMSYDAFLKAYFQIIAIGVERLKPDSFACFVVGDVRDSKGIYRGFVADTMRAFEDAGAKYYNDAVLLTQVASGAIRAGRMFTVSRKLCKCHQNVLVFVKGDAKRATAKLGDCEWGELASTERE